MFSQARTKACTATLALLACAPGAFAASTTELIVKGLITPSACTPSMSAGGVIDLGKISAKDLSPSQTTVIGEDVMQLDIRCEAPTLIALQSLDNRAGTALQSNHYGIGTHNNRAFGGYSLKWVSPMSDDVPAKPITSFDQGANWMPLSSWDAGKYMSVSSVADDSTPIALQKLQVELAVSTYIAGTNGMDMTNEIPIDGSVTLEVKYL